MTRRMSHSSIATPQFRGRLSLITMLATFFAIATVTPGSAGQFQPNVPAKQSRIVTRGGYQGEPYRYNAGDGSEAYYSAGMEDSSDGNDDAAEPSDGDANDDTGDNEDQNCLEATFKTGADYLWDYAKNNATIHCKLGTANLATKFDEYSSRVLAVLTEDDLQEFLKEAKASISRSYHRSLHNCHREINRFGFFFEYEVCIPCGQNNCGDL